MSDKTRPEEPIDGKVDFIQTLESHHLEIVRSLDLDRQYILSHLRSKFILDDEDCQLIRSGTTRQQQASKFIDVLLTKGPQGFFYFVEALEIEHPRLYESITGIKAETGKFSFYKIREECTAVQNFCGVYMYFHFGQIEVIS